MLYNIIFMQKVRLLFYWISSENTKQRVMTPIYLFEIIQNCPKFEKKNAVHLVKCVNYLRS